MVNSRLDVVPGVILEFNKNIIDVLKRLWSKSKFSMVMGVNKLSLLEKQSRILVIYSINCILSNILIIINGFIIK